jgi:NAD(P)-dependent dehydrogenase (short-subunit alcohol dehydrogenase family)
MIPSVFDQGAAMAFETTTDEVIRGVDLSGTTAVVTGATSGLGQETARVLAHAGAHVVVCGRTAEKCEATIAAIRESEPGGGLEPEVFDLADLATVRAGAEEIVSRHRRIELLVNNAGVMFTPSGRTADGFETQFGTNHLGHFVLTSRLLPALRAGAPSRVVNLSSAGHGFGGIRWHDPNFETEPYDKFEAYGQSKTANILFTVEFDRRYADAGVRANAVHPGMIMTDLGRHMSSEDRVELGARAARRSGRGGGGLPRFKTVEQGAATSIYAAVAPELAGVGGRYLDDTALATPSSHAIDPDSAARLWALSEELVGEQFGT